MSSKINLITRLQHWMDSVPGQTFLNYAYSWGASIVILGALFKLTHLPGGNLMLFAGMGTEVFVFFLSAFDRPFDKTEIGKELPHDYQTDEEIAATLAAQEKGYAPETEERETPDAIPSTAQAVVFTAPSGVSAPAYVAPSSRAAAASRYDRDGTNACSIGATCCAGRTRLARNSARRRCRATGCHYSCGQRRIAPSRSSRAFTRNGNGNEDIYRKTTNADGYLPEGRRAKCPIDARQ